MWIVNAFLTWMLWRQADAMFEIGTLSAKAWGWTCVVFSAGNGALVAARVADML